MHNAVYELRRIPLLSTSVNSAVHRHGSDGPGRQGDVILLEGIYQVVKLMGDGSGEPLRWRLGAMPYSCKPAQLQRGERTKGLASPPMW
jgi:hypothetical protein